MGCEVHFAPSKYNDPEFVDQLSLEEIEKILDATGSLDYSPSEIESVASIDELAKRVGKERAVVSHTLQLTLLSPEIIHMALTGTLPPSVDMKSLKAALPPDWENQKEFLGID